MTPRKGRSTRPVSWFHRPPICMTVSPRPPAADRPPGFDAGNTERTFKKNDKFLTVYTANFYCTGGVFYALYMALLISKLF
jgi:hypothetical protein